MSTERRDLVGRVTGALDAWLNVKTLADEACYSVAQTYRILEKAGQRSPLRTRKRLLMERAAWEMTHREASISEIALDAGFESLEGFSRAFRSTFGVSPRAYRRLAPTDYRIGMAGLHFHPASSPLDRRQGNLTMTLLDLIFDDHKGLMHKALDIYAELSEEQRQTIIKDASPFPWEPDDLPLSQVVARNCGFGEPWIHQLDGEPESKTDGSIESLRALLEENHRRFTALVRKVEKEGTWDLTFVDSECDPPEVFSYGGIVNMQIVYTSHERVVLEQALRKLGKPISF